MTIPKLPDLSRGLLSKLAQRILMSRQKYGLPARPPRSLVATLPKALQK